MNNLYLKSIESRIHQDSHAIEGMILVDGNKAQVRLVPPIPGFAYKQAQDLEMVVLAPRYVDSPLFPEISEFPCPVNICIPKEGGTWSAGPWRLLDIGEITNESTSE